MLLNNQADLAYADHRYAEAEPLYRQALHIVERAGPGQESALAPIRHNLANLFTMTGRALEALDGHLAALAAARDARPPDHGVLLESAVEVARLGRDLDRKDTACEAAHNALERMPATDPRRTELIRILEDAAGDVASGDGEVAARELAELTTTTAAEQISAGDLTGALATQTRAVVLITAYNGPDDPNVANAIGNLADTTLRLGRHEAAEDLARRSLASRLDRLAPDDPAIAGGRQLVARVLSATGRDTEAREQLRQAVSMLDRAGHRQTIQFSAALSGLALAESALAVDTDAVEHAVEHAAESVRIARELCGPDSTEHGHALTGQAKVLRAAGHHEDAARSAREAWQIARATLPPDHSDVLRRQLQLAELLTLVGDADEARELALGAERGPLGDGHDVDPEIAVTAARQLGRAALRERRPAQAARHFERAEKALLRMPGSDVGVAPLLIDQAQADRELGDLARAEQRLRRALELVREQRGATHPDAGRALLGLSRTLHLAERRAEALTAAREALDILRRALGPADVEATAVLVDIADIQLGIGAVHSAEYLLAEAAAVLEPRYPADHPDLDGLRLLQAKVQRVRGDFPAAATAYGAALRTVSRGSAAHRAMLPELAVVYAADGRIPDALAVLEEMIAEEDEQLDDGLTALSDRQRVDYLTSLRRTTTRYLMLVGGFRTDEAGLVERAFELVLRRKAAATRVAVGYRRAVHGSSPQLAAALWELDELRARLGRGEGSPTDDDLSRADRRGAELERLLAERTAGPRSAAHRPTVAAVAAALPPQSSLVELIRCPGEGDSTWRAVLGEHSAAGGALATAPARYLAFVLPAGRADRLLMVDLGPAEPIDTLTEAVRDAVESQQEGWDRAGGEAARLRGLLIDPVLHAAGEGALIIAPDGPLCFLPLELLPDGAGRMLLDERLISYVTSGADLLPPSRPGGPRTGAVVVADPDFTLGSDPAAGAADLLPRLPAAQREGQDVAGLLGARLLDGAAATAAAVRAVDRPAVLHIATHGVYVANTRVPERDDVFDRIDLITVPGEGTFAAQTYRESESPNPGAGMGRRSALALAGAATTLTGGQPPPPAGDGFLTAEDVAGLDLHGTRLVVLSACDTGMGHLEDGEGVLGLRRGFVLAGAETLIMSLWQVPDRPTRLLMRKFYERVLRGESRAGALRAAKLEVRARFPDPRSWAAFICQGRPEPIAPQPG